MIAYEANYGQGWLKAERLGYDLHVWQGCTVATSADQSFRTNPSAIGGGSEEADSELGWVRMGRLMSERGERAAPESTARVVACR